VYPPHYRGFLSLVDIRYARTGVATQGVVLLILHGIACTAPVGAVVILRCADESGVTGGAIRASLRTLGAIRGGNLHAFPKLSRSASDNPLPAPVSYRTPALRGGWRGVTRAERERGTLR